MCASAHVFCFQGSTHEEMYTSLLPLQIGTRTKETLKSTLHACARTRTQTDYLFLYDRRRQRINKSINDVLSFSLSHVTGLTLGENPFWRTILSCVCVPRVWVWNRILIKELFWTTLYVVHTGMHMYGYRIKFYCISCFTWNRSCWKKTSSVSILGVVWLVAAPNPGNHWTPPADAYHQVPTQAVFSSLFACSCLAGTTRRTPPDSSSSSTRLTS